MMLIPSIKYPGSTNQERGFTLVEIVIATALSAVVLGGMIYGYVLSAQRAEWSAYSLAANSLAMMRIEQARAAKWDMQAWPIIDELVAINYPVSQEVLDIPIRTSDVVYSNGIPVSGSGVVYATNITTISYLSTNPPLKMIRVDCLWMFMGRGPFTNTVVTYRTTDQ